MTFSSHITTVLIEGLMDEVPSANSEYVLAVETFPADGIFPAGTGFQRIDRFDLRGGPLDGRSRGPFFLS